MGASRCCPSFVPALAFSKKTDIMEALKGEKRMGKARTVVIGGGAAGMAAAIVAAECGEEVVLLERMDRVGKKLLATGNGRCNLMNTGPLCYPGGADFAARVLSACDSRTQTRFWQAHGLTLRQEEGGRVYPASAQASTVLDVLRLSMENAGVEVRTSQEVTGLQPAGNAWRVAMGPETLTCRRVIVAGGGCAQPKLGSNGSCYPLLSALGHPLTKPRPALTQIETDTEPIRGLSGLRVKCGVAVEEGGRVLHEEQGEALFTDYGVSGVCVMQCARYARRGGALVLNLLPALGFPQPSGEEALHRELLARRERWPAQPMEALLTGLCVPRLSLALGKAAGVAYRNRQIASLTREECQRLAHAAVRFTLPVKGCKGYDTAQVTSGGIDAACFDARTMESRLTPGLYAAGEVLDVDGDCGGFNLMFAFGSGMLAGLAGRENPYGGVKNDDY